MTQLLQDLGVHTHTERDHLLLEPEELEKPTKGGYQVFTPFSKRWLEILRSPAYRGRVSEGAKPKGFALQWKATSLEGRRFADQLENLRREASKRATVSLPQAGHAAALERLDDFIEQALEQYETGRDIPARPGTSGLSIYLKNGSITSAQVFARIAKNFPRPHAVSAVKFRSEIIWREFYYHLLWRTPEVEKRAFLQKYDSIRWPGRDEWFEAWKEGRTGFPIVDAGMRQLRATGWMHNRVRMIVASFLTKDLLLDWRRGEEYFMKVLLDGDLAPNNGGWQWAASTGADPQPYFRIFNPTLQAKRFDPDGQYIRHWVPEFGSEQYPQPIVEHAVQSKRAIQLYSSHAST